MVFQTSMPSYRFVYHLYPSFLNMYRGEKLCVYQYGGYLFRLIDCCLTSTLAVLQLYCGLVKFYKL